MKKFIIVLSAFALLTACNNTSTNKETEGENIKKTAISDNFIALEDIVEKAPGFVDKEIQTQGIVDHLCKHGGKRIFLVKDGVDLHINGEERFDDTLEGEEIIVTGILREYRTDEASLLKMEEDAINSHNKGEDAETRKERTIEYVNMMRDSLIMTGVDHFSDYELDFVSLEIVK